MFSTALYACEAWVVTAEIKKNFGIRKNLLQKRFKNRMETRNEEMYDRIHLKETLLQKVIRRKLQLFGHICRMDKNRKNQRYHVWNGRGNE